MTIRLTGCLRALSLLMSLFLFCLASCAPAAKSGLPEKQAPIPEQAVPLALSPALPNESYCPVLGAAGEELEQYARQMIRLHGQDYLDGEEYPAYSSAFWNDFWKTHQGCEICLESGWIPEDFLPDGERLIFDDAGQDTDEGADEEQTPQASGREICPELERILEFVGNGYEAPETGVGQGGELYDGFIAGAWNAYWQKHKDCPICLKNGDVPQEYLG